MHKAPWFWSVISFLAGSALQISDWKNIQVATVLWAIGAVLLVWAMRDWFRSNYYLQWPIRKRKTDTKTTPSQVSANEPEYISLRDAAVELYENSLTSKRLLATVAEQMSGNFEGRIVPGSPNDRLDFLATHIARHITVYGKKDPSRILAKIEDQEVKGASFHDGAMVLRDNFYNKSIFWTDLAVRTHEF